MTPTHDHPESASIRELNAVKDALLQEMAAMEGRLAKKIDEAFHVHAEEHADIAAHATVRHRGIDDFIATIKVAEVRAEGRSSMLATIGGVLRMVNEFRWLIAVAFTALLFLLGNLTVSITPHP